MRTDGVRARAWTRAITRHIMTRKGRRCRGVGATAGPAGARAALLVFGSMHADAEHEPAAARGTEGDDPSCFPFGPRSVIDRSRWNGSMLETGGHVPRSACRRGVASPCVRAWPVAVVAYTATGGRAGRGSSSSIRVIYVSPWCKERIRNNRSIASWRGGGEYQAQPTGTKDKQYRAIQLVWSWFFF